MKKWVEDICYALCHQTTKNIRDTYIERIDNKIVGACALGELLLQKQVDKNFRDGIYDRTSTKIRRSLLEKYKVPKDMINDVFHFINALNVAKCLTKKQISKKVKEKYK